MPLLALVVAKLADYVLDERPGSADDHVFLRLVAPHTRLSDHASVHRVIVETFRKAGVTDVKAGTRLLRHNAASRLLRAAVPLPTISAVLGHASEESTNLYMSVDRERLLDCVLPVPESARPMSGHGFTSAFAAELDAYLAFKANMGFFGASRIWYLKTFDAYCSRARPDRLRQGHRRRMGQTPSWTVRAVTGRGCPTSATSAAGCRRTGSATPMCSPTGGKPRSSPPVPTCWPRHEIEGSSPPQRSSRPPPRGGGRRSRSSP